MTKNFYSTIEAARILRVSRISVFKQIKSGRIKAEKIGRNYIISHNVLVEALGKEIGTQKKEEIKRAIEKAMKDYGETFRRLGRT